MWYTIINWVLEAQKFSPPNRCIAYCARHASKKYLSGNLCKGKLPCSQIETEREREKYEELNCFKHAVWY